MARCCKLGWGLLVLLALAACSSLPEETGSKREGKAYTLIDKAISAHGGDRYQRMEVMFGFRGIPFSVRQKGGQFTYTQQRIDSLGDTILYVLDNAGLVKKKNGEPTEQWEAKEAAKYGETTNSVVYFALLPYGLQSPAVVATYLDSLQIKGNPYHKIQVSFQEEGGGEDFEDVFVYWIHAKSYTIDYLAYEYHTSGGGIRFRDAYRVHTINGVRWQDYINYKPISEGIKLQDLDSLFMQGELKELSTIDLEHIQLKILPVD